MLNIWMSAWMKQDNSRVSVAQHPFLQQGMLSLKPKNSSKSYPAVTDDGKLFYTQNGRSAIELGMQSLGIGSGDEVLIPGYHCPVMVFPVEKLGARPIFYKIQLDCTPDLGDVEAKISSSTRAIMAVHYFGWANEFSELRCFCREHGIALIEDCAHCFFGSKNGVAVGSIGDIAIASIWKFFPLASGGVLRINSHDPEKLPLQPRSSLYKECKDIFNTLEMSSYHGLCGVVLNNFLRAVHLAQHRSNKHTHAQITSFNQKENKNPYANHFIASTYSKCRMSLALRWMFQCADKEYVAEIRRKNFSFLTEHFKNFSNISCLFKEMSEKTVPYVFPIIIQDSGNIPRVLRNSGIQILRFGEYLWQEGKGNDCKVSNMLSQKCIQLPLHQSLSRADLEYMANLLRA